MDSKESFADFLDRSVEEAKKPVVFSDSEIMLYSRDEWANREKVAWEAHDKIRGAIEGISTVGDRNVYGECAEGREFHSRLQAFVRGLDAAWTAQAAQVAGIAQQCARAREYLEQQDIANKGRF